MKSITVGSLKCFRLENKCNLVLYISSSTCEGSFFLFLLTELMMTTGRSSSRGFLSVLSFRCRGSASAAQFLMPPR